MSPPSTPNNYKFLFGFTDGPSGSVDTSCIIASALAVDKLSSAGVNLYNAISTSQTVTARIRWVFVKIFN